MWNSTVRQIATGTMTALQPLWTGSNSRRAALVTVDQGIAYIAPQGAAVAGFGLSVTPQSPLLLRYEELGEGICAPWVVSCTVNAAKIGVLETVGAD